MAGVLRNVGDLVNISYYISLDDVHTKLVDIEK